LPTDVASFHYTTVLGKRFYEIAPVPDSCYYDTLLADTICVRDTLVDSVWGVTTIGATFWARSYRAFRLFGASGTTTDTGATSRSVGRLADTLLFGESLQAHLLEAPLAPNRTWDVYNDGTVIARLTAEETLPLKIGMIRTWRVERGAVGTEWYAPGLGRVQYEEINRSGKRINAQLIALGSL
jgi:hypothetical protein